MHNSGKYPGTQWVKIVLKQFKLNILILYFLVRFNRTREITAVGRHSNVYELVSFKLGMMIDTIVLYISILV